MTVAVQIGNLSVQVTAQPLNPEAFAPFGQVIANPRPNIHPTTFASQASSLPPNAETANQGTAIKYSDVCRPRNVYHQAPSRRSEPKMSMFVCAARQLTSTGSGSEGKFHVRILERHPFTTQTFTPVSSSASTYLVIVAPSLAPGPQDEGLPVPSDDGLPGRGLPDVRGLRAFVAEANQAVTYGAGTWHAPMVALGEPGAALDFVVFQFASGEAVEDCQIAEFESSVSNEPKVTVLVPQQKTKARL